MFVNFVNDVRIHKKRNANFVYLRKISSVKITETRVFYLAPTVFDNTAFFIQYYYSCKV